MIRPPRFVRRFALVSLLAVAGNAFAGNEVAPGHRFYGPTGSTDTLLVDNQGKVVHTFPSAFQPGVGTYMLHDGSILRAIRTGNGHNIGGVGGGIQRIAFDGTVLWDWRHDGPGFVTHHSLFPMPNRNVLAIVWVDYPIADAIANGRDPATVAGFHTIVPDSIIEVKPTGPTSGEIVWRWDAFDHLVQDFDPTKPNFGVVKDHPELLDINFPMSIPPAGGAPGVADWMHVNNVAYSAEHDWVILCSPNFNEVWIIDHSTTTAEAKGHTGGKHGKGGDFLYRWGNPEAYDAGTPADRKLFFQHGAYFIPPGYPGEGNVLIFNNNAGSDYSSVDEIVLPINDQGGFTLLPNGTYGPLAPVWSYTAPVKQTFHSQFISNAIRLPNGNTLIDSGAQSWIFEVTPDKTKVFDYFNTVPTPTSIVFRADYTERTLWTNKDVLGVGTGGTVDFNVVAGSAFAGKGYLLLGSLTGTDPGFNLQGKQIPLNLDAYFAFTANFAGSGVLPNSMGTLDALGKATPKLVIPPGAAAPVAGFTMNHAYVVFEPSNGKLLHVSNPVSLKLQ
jgi:hypothetical protein